MENNRERNTEYAHRYPDSEQRIWKLYCVKRRKEGKVNRVAFVISSLDTGGAQRAVSNIIMNFPEGWEIDLILNNDKNIVYPYRGNVISLDISEPPKRTELLYQGKVFTKRIHVLRRLKKEKQYIAVISFLDSANIANVLSGKRHCKVLISVRNNLKQQSELPQYKYIVNPLSRLLYNKADKVVAVSEGIAEEIKKYYKIKNEKVYTIGNGYLLEELKKKSKEEIPAFEKDLFAGNKVVIAVGRLTEQKAYWHLIRAFAKVHKNNKDIRLVILGEGNLRDYLSKLIQTCGLEGKVILMGFVKNPYKYLAHSHVFVMPSMYEGFPNAMAEAMCLGIPCIATDFRTGARELLEPNLVESKKKINDIWYAEYGILTPLCSGKKYLGEALEPEEDILARAIGELCTHEDKRTYFAKKSLHRAESLNIATVVKQWLSIVNLETCL